MVRRCGPFLVGNGEIAGREINLDGGSVVAPVLAGHGTAAAPFIGFDADAVEEGARVVGCNVEKQLQPVAARTDLGIGVGRGQDVGGPRREAAVVQTTIEIDAGDMEVGSEISEFDSEAAALAIDDAARERLGLGAQ